jgi:hypothetical protein
LFIWFNLVNYTKLLINQIFGLLLIGFIKYFNKLSEKGIKSRYKNLSYELNKLQYLNIFRNYLLCVFLINIVLLNTWPLFRVIYLYDCNI